MLYEFIHDHKVYAIKKSIDSVSDNETVVLFRDIQRVRAFFNSAAANQRESGDLVVIARRLGIAHHQSSQNGMAETIERLCQKIYSGDFVLVEIKPKPVIKFEECCIKSIETIKIKLECSKILNPVLLASKLVLLFFSHPRESNLVDLTKEAYDFSPFSPVDEWNLLAKAIISVPKIAKKESFKIAEIEVLQHIKDNRQTLQSFWEGVMNAFA